MPRTTTREAPADKSANKRKTSNGNGKAVAAKASDNVKPVIAKSNGGPKPVLAKAEASDKPARSTPARVSPEQRARMIQEAAYLRAERRGFKGGDPVKDWLEAEAEINARLAKS